MSLTPKQEKFCQCIVSGMSGKDSYITSYNCNSDNAAMVESTKLLARDDINERLKELRKPIETLAQTTAINERQKKRDVLWSIVEAPDSTYNDKCRALDLLNKMDSEYININRNIEEKSIPLDNLDAETLRKLAEDTKTE